MRIYLHPNVNFDSRNKSLYPYETQDNFATGTNK